MYNIHYTYAENVRCIVKEFNIFIFKKNKSFYK